MRKFCLLLLIVAGIPFFLKAQAKAESWYRCYQGSIGNYVIIMHLHKAGNAYYGYYYYDKSRQQPIFMTGNDTAAGQGKLKLLAFVPAIPKSHEIFTLLVSGNKLTGEWQKNEDRG